MRSRISVFIAGHDEPVAALQPQMVPGRLRDDDLSPVAQRDGAPDILAGRRRRDGPDAFQGLGLQKAVDRDAVDLREPRRLFEVGRGLAVLPLCVCLAGDLDLFGDLLL